MDFGSFLFKFNNVKCHRSHRGRLITSLINTFEFKSSSAVLLITYGLYRRMGLGPRPRFKINLKPCLYKTNYTFYPTFSQASHIENISKLI